MALEISAHSTDVTVQTAPLVANETAFAPDPLRARVLASRIQSSLAESLREIIEASRGIIEFDFDAAARQIRRIESATAVSPSVYARYYEILFAVAAQEHARASSLLTSFCETAVESPRLLFRNFSDADLGPGNAARYAYFLDSEKNQPINLTAVVDEGRFELARTTASDALRLLDDVVPELGGEIRQLLTEVVFARSAEGSEFIFGGASSFFLWGALLINAENEQSTVAMASSIVHECAHSLLFAIAAEQPLVQNDDSARYRSPLRPDPRPLDGIFHATYVSARMHYALSRLLKSELLDESAREEAAASAVKARQDFDDGLEVIATHATLTRLGEAILAASRAYMAGAS